MEKTVSFVVLFGLPGSGKSTFSRVLAGHCKEEGLLCTEISRDLFRLQEDGTYKFIMEREPAIQAAHLESLCQLSEERIHDVIIVDDANLNIDQILSTLLAINNNNNNVFLVDICPLPIEIHAERLKANGHAMPAERLIEMRRIYYQTKEKVNTLNIHMHTIKVANECFLDGTYNEQQASLFEQAIDSILKEVESKERFCFEFLGFHVEHLPWVKRTLLDKFKKHVQGVIQEKEEEPATKKSKQ